MTKDREKLKSLLWSNNRIPFCWINEAEKTSWKQKSDSWLCPRSLIHRCLYNRYSMNSMLRSKTPANHVYFASSLTAVELFNIHLVQCGELHYGIVSIKQCTLCGHKCFDDTTEWKTLNLKSSGNIKVLVVRFLTPGTPASSSKCWWHFTVLLNITLYCKFCLYIILHFQHIQRKTFKTFIGMCHQSPVTVTSSRDSGYLWRHNSHGSQNGISCCYW